MKLLSFIRAILSIIPVILFCGLILLLTLRGKPGNPTSLELNDPYWKDEGPMELSPERGRFALMYSLVEDKSYQFSLDIARFAAPDVAYSNGEFSSMFAPALSFIIIPGYILGKTIGLAQVGTYAVISLFAILNVLLIRGIALRLGAHRAAATLAGLLYLFATPAFAYSVSLYQHQVSTFLILSSLFVLVRWKNVFTLTYVWLACAFSVVLDNPNLFFMTPIGLFALTRLIPIEETKQAIKLHFKPLGVLTLAVMILPMAFFMHINYQSYGNPFQLAGTVDDGNEAIARLLGQGQQSTDLADQQRIEEATQTESETSKTGYEEDDRKTALGFFKTRQLPTGFHTHFLSADRGMRTYTPVMLLGFIGLFLLASNFTAYHRLFLAVIGANILLYSMWGDPYGGWAFGSRYLIPTYALLSIGLAVLLTRFKHNLFILLLVAGLSGYSVFVNTVGAAATNRIPPKVQVLALEEETGVRQRYTFTRSMEMLNDNRSKSYFFQTVGHNYVTAWQFVQAIMAIIGWVYLVLLLKLFLSERKFNFRKHFQKAESQLIQSAKVKLPRIRVKFPSVKLPQMKRSAALKSTTRSTTPSTYKSRRTPIRPNRTKRS